jgi:hypothetical protein
MSYFLIKHVHAKRMQPSSTEIILTFLRQHSCLLFARKVENGTRNGIYDDRLGSEQQSERQMQHHGHV